MHQMTRIKSAPAAIAMAIAMVMALTLLGSPVSHAQSNRKPTAAPSKTPTPTGESRGEMLYSVSCGACHATEVHWRAKKLATDPERLRREVLRWKDNVGAEWNIDDVNEVTRYLDATFYRFPAAASESGLQPQMQGDIRYISGGLQAAERKTLRAMAKEYNLRLTFAGKPTPTHFEGIRITITDAKQETVLEAVAHGPLFLARLPDGRYRANVEKGEKRLDRDFTIRQGKPVALRF